MPGVPDVYQGCELTGLALVDPDNRRPVDFTRGRELLAAARAPGRRQPAGWTEKLLVTSAALRLRRAHPDWFAAGYQPAGRRGPGGRARGRVRRGGRR